MLPFIPEMSINGKDVSPLQLRQVPSPDVPAPNLPVADEKSRAGKEVREEQSFHVL